MLHLKVSYFLDDAGMKYFASWFDEVYKITSLQDGFKSMRYEHEANSPVVYLDFENQDTLDTWCDTPQHDQLASKIEQYFIKPPEVKSETGP